MQHQDEVTFQYDTAEGLTALRQVLDHYLIKAKSDMAFAKADHYILYKIGDLRSLIKVDTHTVPFHFKYCDLLGRPATKSIRETIARFLWEQCGERERFMKTLADKEWLP